MTKPKEKNYIAIATRYSGDVVSGKILACQWTIKACQRQIDDLEKAKSKSYPYKFDKEKAFRICRFIELLPHIKGKWAKNNARIELQPWQIFILTTVFGWIRKDTGLRRFKTAYLEMPRKNGKSSLSSGVGIFCCCADGEAGSETYSAATTRDQAKIVWQDALNMVERSPGLKKAFGVSTTARAISQISTASRFQALSAEGNSLDGLNIHCAIVDELHACQMLAAGKPITWVSAQLGHKNPQVTLTIYARWVPGTDSGKKGVLDRTTKRQQTATGSDEGL